MNTSRFNPEEYLALNSFTDLEKAQMVADAVRSRGVDITAAYADWLGAGLALGHGLGEAGRAVFHDISRLYPGYTPEETDRQYDSCMKPPSAGRPIALATFFKMAEEKAGVSLAEVMREEREKRRKQGAKCDKCDSVPLCQNNIINNIYNNKYTDNQGVMKNEDFACHSGTVSHLSHFCKDTENGYVFSSRISVSGLPPFLQRIFTLYDDAVSRDKILLAVINVASGLLGACNGTAEELSGIYGLYKRQKVYAPLYNIIYANAGSGKGEVNVCRQLIRPLQEEMSRRYHAERAEYERALAAWESSRKGKKGGDTSAGRPSEPLFRSPMTAGNSSSSSVYHTLHDNGGWALMFETEADTVSQMQKTEYGNYSDLLRKAYHHEALSMNRSTDNLHIYIAEPRLSVMLTCTPGQIGRFLGDFENGLASRFFFYALPSAEPKFDDVFSGSEKSLDEEFLEMGKSLMPLLDALRRRKGNPLQFVMTDDMQKDFLATFREILNDNTQMLGRDFSGFIYRLALGCFRYAMVLTALRLLEMTENGIMTLDDNQKALICDERDYETAKTIVEVLLNHSAKVYARLAKEADNPFADKGISLTPEEKQVYAALPDEEFKTAVMVDIVAGSNGSRRKAARMLSKFCNEYSIVIPTTYGRYIKASSLAARPGDAQAETQSAAAGGADVEAGKPFRDAEQPVEPF